MDLLSICEKGLKNKGLDNLLTFWEKKVKKNLKSFSQNQDIHTLIEDIDKIIENVESKKIKKPKKKLELNFNSEEKNKYMQYQSEGNYSNLKVTIEPNDKKFNPLKKSIFSDNATPASMFIIPSSKMMESFKNYSPSKYMNYGNDDTENQKEKRETYTSRMNSIKVVNKFDFNSYNNNQEEDGKNTFLRFSNKKSVTLHPSKLNALEVKLFNFQEEQRDNNFIMKTKLAKTFINFIDIDLFLQYIALDKNFFEKEEDNDNLIEGFCVQYQTFMFPENLVNKIISCFEYFYTRYINKDNKTKGGKGQNVTSKKGDFKVKSNFDDAVIKIPFGLIDFVYTFINLHNTYYHTELSTEVMTKLKDFLKYLMGIKEVKNKYEKKIHLSETKLKEYDESIKKFNSVHKASIDEAIDEAIEEKNSSEDSSDNEGKKKVKFQKKDKNNFNVTNTTKNNMLKSVKTLNPKTLNLNFDDNKFGLYETGGNERQKTSDKIIVARKFTSQIDDRPYEFDLLNFSPQDIATELTRVNYTLYSKIKLKEFLKGAFNGKDKYKSSPHICQIVNRFNKLSYFVIEEILAYDHAEKRAEILLRFIKICSLLKDMGNFDDFLSIMTGLTNCNISKLNKTWGHIPSGEVTNFHQMKKILSFEDNWKCLRKEIQKKIDAKSFYIPYLGYYTKRMLFLEEMGPYIKKDTALINLEKIFEVYQVIKHFYQVRNVKFSSSINEAVKRELSILQCLDPSNEDFLVETSNLLEPKFILSNKKLKVKRRTKTDINFIDNINKFNLL
jgi:hypothetical protein